MYRGDKRDQSAEMQSPLVSSNQSRLRNMGWEIEYMQCKKNTRTPQTQKDGKGNCRTFALQQQWWCMK